MGLIDKLFSGGASAIAGAVDQLVGRFVESPAEKNELTSELRQLIAQRDTEIEHTFRVEMESKQAIMVAEMKNGDKWTSRARPMIIYAGLGAFILNGTIFPIAMAIILTIQGVPWHLINMAQYQLPVPQELIAGWTVATSVYAWSRGKEKLGSGNAFTKALTGVTR